MRVVELRNYRLADGAAGEFIRYFEEHFLVSQREEGMHVLGQFAVVGEPDRFVWLRGFEDMAARQRGLSRFYGGPFWLARRATANGMILDSDDVHLLRPLGAIEALTGGLALEDRAPEPPGTLPAHTGLVAADFYRAAPDALDRLVSIFEQRLRPALVEQGHQVLGHFVAELAPNDYPRLPVIQDARLLLVLSAYRDGEHHAALQAAWRGGDPWRALRQAEVGTDVATLRLRPTARSLIRFRSGL